MIWSVEFDETAAKELRKLYRQAQQEILRYFREHIVTNDDPSRFYLLLSHNLTGLWRYCVRNYHIICKIRDDTPVVLVLLLATIKTFMNSISLQTLLIQGLTATRNLDNLLSQYDTRKTRLTYSLRTKGFDICDFLCMLII